MFQQCQEASLNKFSLWRRHLFLRPIDRLLVIYAYADETGHPCDPHKHVFGFGAFIGRISDWEKFSAEWPVQCPPEFYPFHMLEFVKKTRGNDAVQRKVLGSLVKLIHECNIVPITALSHVCDFRKTNSPLTDREGSNLYQLVLEHLFAQVTIAVIGAQQGGMGGICSSNQKVSIVFAQRRFASKVTDLWWESKETGKGSIASALSGLILNSVSVAEPSTVVPLQAADFLAWEVGHHFEKMQGKEPRWTYKQLMKIPEIPEVAIPTHSFVSPNELSGEFLVI